MKKVLVILFALFLFSCNQDKGCYICTTTFKITYTDDSGVNTFSVSDDRTRCDVSESEIREYETANTDSVSYTNGPLRIDTVTVTLCRK